MKKLTFLLALLPLVLRADDAANILVSLRDHGLSIAARRTVLLTPLSPNQRTYSTNLFTYDPLARQTDTNGICVFSNLLWGSYRLDIFGKPGMSYTLTLGTNHSGTVSAAALKDNPDALPPNPSTNYYTMSQVDALLALVGGGGGGGGSGQTNQVFAGDYIDVATTNSGKDFVVTANAAALAAGGPVAAAIAAAQSAALAALNATNSVLQSDINSRATTNDLNTTSNALAQAIGAAPFYPRDSNPSNYIAAASSLSSDQPVLGNSASTIKPVSIATYLSTLGLYSADQIDAAIDLQAVNLTNVVRAQTRRLNVLNFGASPTNCLAADDNFNGHSLTPCDTAYAAALSDALSSTGATATIYFPPGIYRFTNTIAVPPKISLVGAGIFHSPGWSDDVLHTNGYSTIWLDNTNAPYAVNITEPSKNTGLVMQDIQVCGFTNPVANLRSTIALASSSAFGKVGILAQSGNWAGGMKMFNVSVSGFKVGIDCSVGQSTFEMCQYGGNDVGLVNGALGDSYAYGQLTNIGLAYLTSYLELCPTGGVWGNVLADNLYLVNCAGGARSNGVVHLFTVGPRDWSIQHDSSYDYGRLLVQIGGYGSINDTYNEVSGGHSFGCTNLIVLGGQTRLTIKDSTFEYNAQTGSQTNYYGNSMTNFALIDDFGGSAIVLNNVGGMSGIPDTDSAGFTTLVRQPYDGGSVTPLGITRGYWECRRDAPRYRAYLARNSLLQSWIDQLNNPVLLGPYYGTNFDQVKNNLPYGRITMQLSQPDYFAAMVRDSSIYDGSFPSPYDGQPFHWVRLLQSDPATQIITTPGTWNRHIPENYTVDQLTARSNIVGNASGVTNLNAAHISNWSPTNGPTTMTVAMWLGPFTNAGTGLVFWIPAVTNAP